MQVHVHELERRPSGLGLRREVRAFCSPADHRGRDRDGSCHHTDSHDTGGDRVTVHYTDDPAEQKWPINVMELKKAQ